MTDFFIHTPEESGFRVEPTRLAGELTTQWPEAQVTFAAQTDRSPLLEWNISMTYGRLDGSLDHSGEAIYLEGDERDCARFALWYQQKLAPDCTLIYYSPSLLPAKVDLDQNTTEAQLVDPFV